MTEMMMFEPLTGVYDLDAVAAAILAMPFTFRDPSDDKGPFLLCGNAEMTGACRRQLLGDPDAGYPHVAMAILKPERIMLSQVCEADSAAQAREFAEWLRSEYPSRILDGYGTDFTALCKDTLDPLYQD
ncbi:hypothetical protein HSX11_08560 [Oxalobacteraceae bacterium]|nr:hypothetical protein [Oxalobacteraceae bacterium]